MIDSHSSTARWLTQSIENYKRKLGIIVSPNEINLATKKTRFLTKEDGKENIEIDSNINSNANNNIKAMQSLIKASSEVTMKPLIKASSEVTVKPPIKASSEVRAKPPIKASSEVTAKPPIEASSKATMVECKKKKENKKSDDKDLSSHPRYLEVMSMKVIRLRKEMKQLNLNTTGLKKDLQKRLLEATAVKFSSASKTLKPSKPMPISAKKFFTKSFDDDDSVEEPKEEKQIINLISSSQTNSQKVKIFAQDKVETNKVTSKEGKEVDSLGEKKSDTDSHIVSLFQNEINKDSSSEETSNKKIESGDSNDMLKNSTTQAAPGNVKTKAAAFSDNVIAMKQKSIVKPLSFKSVKQFGQSSSQVKLDKSPKKPQKQTSSLKHAKSCQIPKIISLKPSVQSVGSTKISHGFKRKEVVTTSNPILKKTLSKIKGMESLKSSAPLSVTEKLKLQSEARKQRLAEMRSKSKPIMSTKKVGNSLAFQNAKNKIFSVPALKTNDKRTLMTAKIREKHAALKSQGVGKVVIPPLQSSFTLPTVPKITLSSKKKAKSLKPSPSVKNLLSPHSTYEISDRGEDTSSDESDVSNKGPRKKVPNWAQKDNLLKALHKQYGDTSEKFDPDSIFPEVETCDLTAIFNKKKNRYKKRASTGNWLGDSVSAAERLTYKRDMGFSTTCTR
eukprot:CAMPEP_0194171976 /NCGR_PEP_ID=MMETSP0154-20130528/6528_1 /TAXON_ID=1049557 /ORGANISM="Thalassiothrix antarctica, Strain L6-D1" /LENGTH=672 /DNA_ID=CAMNT_0038884509 /DNA_START=211 /DNA_END=2229 /DNA_ORIENTATION=-